MAKASKVYITHARSDAEIAQRLSRGLVDHGFDVYDDVSIGAGENWAKEVGDALENADAMVVLLSPDAMESEWVRNDIRFALTNRRFAGKLFPVLVRTTPRDKIPWILRHLDEIQLLDARGSTDPGPELVKALRATTATSAGSRR